MAGNYLPKARIGPGGMKPLAAPRPPSGDPLSLKPAVGNFSPNNLGVGILSAPMTTVAGAPKVPGVPGAPRTRRRVMGKMKATLRPKAPAVPTGQSLRKIPAPTAPLYGQ